MSNWEKLYLDLRDYVARTPQIEIDRSFMVIPAEVRPEFNRHFDAVRVAFVEDKFPDLLAEATELSRHYRAEAQEAARSLKLSDIKLPVNLQALVADPLSGLTRYLFDPLFDLVKGKTDFMTFERQASETVEDNFKKVFRQGYEEWVYLSLVNLLAPDKALAVPAYDLEITTRELEPDEKRGIYKAEVPAPKETKTLSFDRAGAEPPFVISDIVLHSTRLNRYVAMRSDLKDSPYSAKDVSENREWLKVREVGILYRPTFSSWPDIVMCVEDQPRDIALIADFSRFCRPDVIVECVEQTGWHRTEELSKVNREYDFFRPFKGTFIVSKEPIPDALKKLEVHAAQETGSDLKNIHIISAGYNKSALQPIVEALQDARAARGAA